MIAIWGNDVVDNLPFPEDDEQYLTVDLPRKLGRRESFPSPPITGLLDESYVRVLMNKGRFGHERPCDSVALLLQRATD